MSRKQNITAFLLAGTALLSLCGCGNREAEIPDNTAGTTNSGNIGTTGNIETTKNVETTRDMETTRDIETTVDIETTADMANMETTSAETAALSIETEEDKEEAFSFDVFKRLQFEFFSGAGAWQTSMSIDADGSFSGMYTDSEMGSTGEGYPDGTVYWCEFSGQFTQPVKVNEYTYSMQIGRLDYAREAGTEEISGGMRYCFADAYGLDDAENILIYLPGAPLTELPEEFRRWVGYYGLSDTEDTKLPFYALNNEAHQYGFSSYDIVDSLRKTIAVTEDWAGSVESFIRNEARTQAELNEKSQKLYRLWDQALNDVWDILKRTQDEESMRALTAEELEWIARKEQAVVEAGAEYEGGSMQPMAKNMKGAELTKLRVYELLGLFD